jgi:crotonobetainyl-CoA:carnitine CoA-transferase CaiB-like acyl-CoA transferase
MFRLPLFAVRVLDLTSGRAGRYAARLLGDVGAEVIRIQAPSRAGVDARLDCNKYGCTFDVSTERGRDLFLRLVDLSDIVVAEPDNLAVNEWIERNERLIVVSLPVTEDVISAVAAAGAAGLALWDRRRTGVGGRIDVAAPRPGSPSRGEPGEVTLEPVSTRNGMREIPGPHWHLSESPAHIRLPAPAPPEHNAYVLRDLLGLSDDEIATLDVG